MGKPRRIRPAGEASGAKGWLTTFNDLITLLMVFFVLLFTMSSVDTKKLKEFRHSLATGLGIREAGDRAAVGLHPSALPDIDPGDTYDPEIENRKHKGLPREVVARLSEKLRKLEEQIGVKSKMTREGANITFDDMLLFDFGKAEVNPRGLISLDAVAEAIKGLPYPIRVEGHTDNVPIRTRRFPSNWDLSIARAVSVVKHFIDKAGVDPGRLSAAGYGESRPLATNDSPRNRSRNRRVEIVLVMEEQ